MFEAKGGTDISTDGYESGDEDIPEMREEATNKDDGENNLWDPYETKMVQ